LGFSLSMVLGFLLVSAAALLVFLLVGKLVRPRVPYAEKLTTYECGERPFGPAWFNFNNRFYIVALVFIVLDVAVVLVFPAVLIFRRLRDAGLGWVAFAAVGLFLAIVTVALIYVWARGDLRWIRPVAPAECQGVEVGAREDQP
jgi:NADH-quinone oxidoreductase subunit A